MKIPLCFAFLALVVPCSAAPAPKPFSQPLAESSTVEERYAAKVYGLRADWAKASLKFYWAFYQPHGGSSHGGPVDSSALRKIIHQYRLQNRRYTQISPVPASLRGSNRKLRAAFVKVELALQQDELFLRDGRNIHLQKAEALNNQGADLMEGAVSEMDRVVRQAKSRFKAPAVPTAPHLANPALPPPAYSQPPLSTSA